MIDTATLNSDFGAIMSDWPEELLTKGADVVRVLVDETSFSKRVADGGLVSDFGGSVYVKRDELTFSLDAKDKIEVRSQTYKVARISESPDRVHLRVDLQVIGR